MFNKISKLSLSAQSLWALVIGLLFGLFFGEDIGWIQIVGDIYIKVMQITIIPYIMVSVLVGLGSMSYQQAKNVALQVGKVMALIWLVGLLIIFLTPQAYPNWSSASFFSDSALLPPLEVDYLKLYIPSNPILSMAEGSIPAIVIFSIAIGVALIGIEDKDILVSSFRTLSEALTRVAKFMIKSTPIGIFAISAASAGTLSVEDFEKLQIYIIVYSLVAIIFTFWILPLFITLTTPFKYKDILLVTRGALITGFATSNLFIVLPMITEAVKTLFEKNHRGAEKEITQYADTIIPVTFNFPALGKLMALMFVLFASWFLGIEIPVQNYPALGINALLSFFGSLNVALPALLEQTGIPVDIFNLFLVSGLVIGKMATLVAVMNLFVLTVVASSAMMGIIQINYKRIAVFSAASCFLVLGSIYATRMALETFYKTEYKMDKVVLNMQVLEELPENIISQLSSADLIAGNGVRTLQQILESGVLNIGYLPQAIPFSYFNDQGKLVGFDIDMMYRLAKDMQIKLKLVPYTLKSGVAMLNSGTIDMAVSGLHMTPGRLTKVDFTRRIIDIHLAIAVNEKNKYKLELIKTGESQPELLISYVGHYPAIEEFKNKYSNIKFIEINSDYEFFNDSTEKYDAHVISVQVGTTWTLIYPQYTILFDQKNSVMYPMAYALALGNYSLKSYMNNWLQLQEYNKKIEKNYNYWVQGKGAEPEVARWSIKRDVLNW